MIRKLTLAALVAILVAPFDARAEDKPAAAFDDAVFVQTVAIGGMYDVYLSDTAGTRTRNSEIRTLAVHIVKDHIAACEQLKAVAKGAGAELPTKLDDAHQKQLEAFKDYKGDNFDRDFVKAIVKSHTDGIALFTRASKEAKNPAIKEFATKTLPTIQKHLEMAKGLDKETARADR